MSMKFIHSYGNSLFELCNLIVDILIYFTLFLGNQTNMKISTECFFYSELSCVSHLFLPR